MPPLANAVCLVDRHQDNRTFVQHLAKIGFTKALRRDVKDIEVAVADSRLSAQPLAALERRIYKRGPDPFGHQSVDLIFH